MTKVKVSVKFEPRDIWIGVYWKYHKLGGLRHLQFYICLLPMLPIYVSIIYAKPLVFK